MNTSKQKSPVVLIGAGGHGCVVLSAARQAGFHVIGVCDPSMSARRGDRWRDLDILGNDDALHNLNPATTGLLNGVGHLPGVKARQQVYVRLTDWGFSFPPIVHPTAWIDPSVCLDDGAQIMAGCIIQAESQIGRNCIVNTRASIDHHCHLGAFVHVAPGATLCGGVNVGDGVFIGAGATIIQDVHIGAGSVIPAGAVITKNIPTGYRIDRASRSRAPCIQSSKNGEHH